MNEIRKNLINEQKKTFGENSARAFLAPSFTEMYEIRIDDGIDIVCNGFNGEIGQPTARFQIKCGESYFNGIRIAAPSLRSLVSRVDDEVILFFHYIKPKDTNFPDYFLVFNHWLVNHFSEVGEALEEETDIRIKHNEFHELGSERVNVMWDAFRDQLDKLSGISTSVFVKRKPHFGSYFFYRYCREVTQSWDLALLCRNIEVLRNAPFPEIIINDLQNFWQGYKEESNISKLFRIRKYHPIARIPPSVIRQAQGRLMYALFEYDKGNEFRFADRFDVFQVNAARVVASRYPRAVIPVLMVLRGWRNRYIAEVLVALQMASTLAIIDPSFKDKLIKIIREIVSDIGGSQVTTLRHFQIMHHAYSVLGAIEENLTETRKAIKIAQDNISFELAHLTAYGWGVGDHVPLFYKQALRRDTVKDTILYDYNLGMYELMEKVISDNNLDI